MSRWFGWSATDSTPQQADKFSDGSSEPARALLARAGPLGPPQFHAEAAIGAEALHLGIGARRAGGQVLAATGTREGDGAAAALEGWAVVSARETGTRFEASGDFASGRTHEESLAGRGWEWKGN